MTEQMFIPPHNIEAEECVIGSVFIEPTVFIDCSLRPDEFYLVKHRWLWETFSTLTTHGHAIDLFTVQEELERRGQLAEIGGPAYVTRLITLTPTAYNATSYAALIKDAAFRRSLIHAASDIVKLAYDVGTDIKTVAASASAAIDAMTPVDGVNVDAWDAAHEWYQEVEQYLTGEHHLLGLTTGYGALDEKTGGVKRGEVTLLAGMPSMGKSSLAFQMMHRQCAQGLKVGLFSQEMRRQDVIERMALARLNMNHQKLKASDLPTLNTIVNEIAHLPFVVNHESGLTVAEIARQAREMQRTLKGLDVVLIDHIGYINHLGEKHDNLPTRIGITTKGLARLAKQMNVAVVALCQLNRDKFRSADKPPTLTDLRDSGHLEADARMVLALHRPEYYSEADSVDMNGVQDAGILILKNHRGPRNVMAKLQFIESSAQFSEAVR